MTGKLKFTYYGHACFGVEVGGKHLLFDPFVTYNELAKHISIDTIPADVILVSHGHMDHIADVQAIATRTGALVVSNYEITEWYKKQGLKNVHPMNPGGIKDFGYFSVKCVVAQHSSGLPDGSYGGNPMGFVVTTADGTFYFAGDTALTMDMQLIPRTSPALTVSLLPIGGNFTMHVDDAILAAEFVGCNKVIGLHFDTFGYIKIDKEAALKAFAAAGKELILIPIGESITI